MMDTHHLLLETPSGNLPQIMQYINGDAARFTDSSTPRPQDPSSRISAAGCRRAFRIQSVTYNLNIYETKAIAILKVKICA